MATYEAQDVIDMAIERAALNDPDLIPEAQSLQYMSTFEKRAFADAAKQNPNYFGTEGTTSRNSSTDYWDLRAEPGNVLAVTKVQVDSITGSIPSISSGDEVNLIDLEHPNVEVSPRAYLRDHKLREYDGELSVDGSNYVDALKVFYSRASPKIQDTNQQLLIPDEWIDLVVLPLARLYAIRDQRENEAQLIQQEYNMNRRIFFNTVGIVDYGSARSLQDVRAPGPVVTMGDDG